MAKTELDGDQQISDYTIAKKDLKTNFLGTQDWDVTDGAKDATLINLKDATDASSPATKGQLDTAISAVNANFDAVVRLAGGITNIATFVAGSATKGDKFLVNVSGDLLGYSISIGDSITVLNDVVGGAMVQADLLHTDNTESDDILRDSDVVDSILSQSATDVLSANQGYELKALIDLVNARVNSRKYGEVLVATQSVAVLPALVNLPVPGTVRVFRNGARMNEGSGNDMTINYATGVITFEFNLKSQDTILTDYEY